MKYLFIAVFFMIATSATAQKQNNDVYELNYKMFKQHVRNEIRIPVVDGFLPLKCDFHMHTVFSDGKVWPSVRVNEAWQQGLDAISITDHIEQRKGGSKILKGDLNESNKIAKETAKNTGLIVINGAEITRAKPFGHMNALFITDAIVINEEDDLKAIDQAIKQGAFIMWNHPGWPDDKSTLYPVHEKLIKENKIHGVEVFGYDEYFPYSFDWCNDFNLAYLGTSDVHDLISIDYGIDVKHRPMSLVFAKEKTEEAIKEAMFARRTIAFFDGQLAGPATLLKKLVQASLKTTIVGEKTIEVYNDSDISYVIKGEGKTIIFPANKTIRITMPTGDYTVDNCHVGTNKKLIMTANELF